LAKGSVAVQYDRCKVCGICVAVCPADNLEIVEGRLSVSDRCTGCKLCELHCPDFALTAERVDRPTKEEAAAAEETAEGGG